VSEPIVVIGGGPAGAVISAMLAKEGVPVTLLEKEQFPRHHVGESLQPAVLEILDRHLGLGPAIKAAGFPRKYGAVYVWGESREPWSVLFDPRLDNALPADEEALLAGDYLHTYNVDRSRFDAILLGEARRRGVDVQHGVEVAAPIMEGERVVGVTTKDGQAVRAGMVVDASGQRCLLGRAFGLTRVVEDLQATATYAYYQGAGGLDGPLGRHVQYVVTVPDGWVWFIPISAELTSVGVVVRERKRLSEERFLAMVAQAELPLNDAAIEGPFHTARDWSFTHRKLAGPGWLLAGDAACFIDPILSGGVDFAVRGGADAALCILRLQSAENPEDEAAILSEYDASGQRFFKAHLKLARYWYGNNRSAHGFFWQAHQVVRSDAISTPLRAFVYLTSGQYAADQHFRVFQQWQEEKMFRALGVDAERLKATWRKRR
jgi:halogenation protein CepH